MNSAHTALAKTGNNEFSSVISHEGIARGIKLFLQFVILCISTSFVRNRMMDLR